MHAADRGGFPRQAAAGGREVTHPLSLRRPIICLVTDRRRLGDPGEDQLVRLVATASAAGVTLIHVRERDLDDRRLLALIRRLLTAVRPETAVVVNDRADVALAAGAAGVHLRSDSVPADRLRRFVPPGFLIGRSVHGAAEAAMAAESGVDYLIMGTTFATTSKDSTAPVAGLDGLADACRAGRVPVVAIGGITLDNVTGIAAAGAAGIAAIGLFAGTAMAQSPELADRAMRRIVDRIKSAWV
jgi:thiamine-phosphate diphosphorylase